MLKKNVLFLLFFCKFFYIEKKSENLWGKGVHSNDENVGVRDQIEEIWIGVIEGNVVKSNKEKG